MEEALDRDRGVEGGGSLDKELPELTLEEEQKREKEHPRQKQQHKFARKGKNMTSRQRCGRLFSLSRSRTRVERWRDRSHGGGAS